MESGFQRLRVNCLAHHPKRGFLLGTQLVILSLFLSIMGCSGPDSDITLGGQVLDTQGVAVASVDITFNWSDGGSRTITTDESGRFNYGYDWWRLDDQPLLEVTVTPSHPAYDFSPPSYQLNGEISNVGIDFIAIPKT